MLAPVTLAAFSAFPWIAAPIYGTSVVLAPFGVVLPFYPTRLLIRFIHTTMFLATFAISISLSGAFGTRMFVAVMRVVLVLPPAVRSVLEGHAPVDLAGLPV